MVIRVGRDIGVAARWVQSDTEALFMKLDDAPESENVEDQRGNGAKYAIGGGAGLVLAVLGLIFGVDFGGNVPGPRKTKGRRTKRRSSSPRRSSALH